LIGCNYVVTSGGKRQHDFAPAKGELGEAV